MLLYIISWALTRKADASSVSITLDRTCVQQLFSFPKKELIEKLDISPQILNVEVELSL